MDSCAGTDPDRIIAACTKIINSKKESKGDRAWAYSNRGVGYENKGDRDRALADYNEAVRLDPKNGDAFRNRGGIYDLKGDRDRAIANYDEALRLNTRDGVAYFNRGNIYESKGDHERAITDYNEAIRLNPKDGDAYLNRGTVYVNKGDNDRAIADLNQAIRLDPKSAEAYTNRGEAYSSKGDYGRAIADLDQAISLKTEYAYAYYQRGLAFKKKGQADRALADLDKAIGFDATFTIAIALRAQVYRAKGDIERAKADFNKALSIPIKPNEWAWMQAEIGKAQANAREQLAALNGAPASGIDSSAPTQPDKAVAAQTQALLDSIAQMYKALGIAPPNSSPSVAGTSTAPVTAGSNMSGVKAVPPHPVVRYGGTQSTYLNAATNAEITFEHALAERPSASGVSGSTTYNAALAGQHGPVKQPEPVVPSYDSLEKSGSTSPSPPPVQQAAETAKPAPSPQSAPQFAAPSVAEQPQPIVPSDEGVGAEKPIPAPPSSTVAAVEPPKATVTAPQPSPKAATPAATPEPLGKRVALVIGNSAYKNTTPLPNPANDASDIAAVLKRLGFTTVIEEKDLDKRGMDDAFRRFAREMADADTAMFFYAGHAMEWQGANYLMPVDAKLEDEADVPYEMAKLNDMVADMSRVKAVRIAVLDACRDNPLENKLKRSIALTRGGAQTRGLARIAKPEGLVIAYATQTGNVAEDGGGRNSPFTAALLEYIETPGLEVGVLFRRVMGNVKQATGGKQHPELSILLDSEFYFKPGS
jgi:tetratricopeptide (TPR) repeat protein